MADERDVEELNHFLRSHKIIDMKRELTTSNDNSCWTFCITYMPDNGLTQQRSNDGKREKIDYKEVLEPASFERFAQMRRLRKDIAEREAVPAYAVFTDAELAEMGSHGDRSAVRLRRPDDGEVDSCQANELSDTGSIQFCFSDDIISAIAAV